MIASEVPEGDAEITRKDPRFRVGLIVPSSNVTMEREIPAILQARQEVAPEMFSFHSSRMRMKNVTSDELRKMDAQAERCVTELADADCDVMLYACLVGVMAQGLDYHSDTEERLTRIARESGNTSPVISSAGALVRALGRLKAQTVAVIAPYTDALMATVTEYIEDQGVSVKDVVNLDVEDNKEVGCIRPEALRDAYERIRLEGVDALVLSACVQMPSLEIVPDIEMDAGIPVVTASIATATEALLALGLDPVAPDAGRLLAGPSQLA